VVREKVGWSWQWPAGCRRYFTLKRPLHARRPQRRVIVALPEPRIPGCVGAVGLLIFRRVADVAEREEETKRAPEIVFAAHVDIESLRPVIVGAGLDRSEERRVGKEC